MQSKTTSQYSDFEIIKQVGKGSYGTVYRVKRKADSQIYAMKVIQLAKLDTMSIQNTLVEIQILCSVQHRNIVGYKEAFLHNNNTEICIIMEYIGGGDLGDKITECKKRKLLINEEIIWSYFIQTLFGLRVLHSMKIIHRDVKSANIFMMEDFETVKLGDLNVAKVAKFDTAKTQIGTPYYLAPEIWKNETYSYKCDIFSLGCVLYEMAALRVPFEAGSLPDLCRKITQGLINKIPSQYSDDLYQVIKLCLRTDPKQRPTVEELLNNPMVMSRVKLVKRDLEAEQQELNKLLATIKFEKKIGKLNINLPNMQRYRGSSADVGKARVALGLEEATPKQSKENPSADKKPVSAVKPLPAKNDKPLPPASHKPAKDHLPDKIGHGPDAPKLRVRNNSAAPRK